MITTINNETITRALRYDVISVPKIIINDTIDFLSALSEDRFVEQVLLALSPPSST